MTKQNAFKIQPPYSLDPDREVTHEVIDLFYDEDVYGGSFEDCQNFVASQGSDYPSYKIVPVTK